MLYGTKIFTTAVFFLYNVDCINYFLSQGTQIQNSLGSKRNSELGKMHVLTLFKKILSDELL